MHESRTGFHKTIVRSIIRHILRLSSDLTYIYVFFISEGEKVLRCYITNMKPLTHYNSSAHRQRLEDIHIHVL